MKVAFITTLTLAAWCSTAILPGCSRQEPSPRYQALSGVVRAIDLETGELLIAIDLETAELFNRAEHPPASWHADDNVPCVTTKDSELYVNDRFSELRDVQMSDALQAIIYRDRARERDGDEDRDRHRFVISFVNITRNEPEPPPPNFALKLTTQPAPEKHED